MLNVARARPDQMHTCLAIRYEVFVLGQGVPPEIEVDGHDPTCIHFLATWKDEAVGTARLRMLQDKRGKAERVAVRPPWQGKGVGAALMRALEAEAVRRGLVELVLNAQEAVMPFYTALGFVGEGERFMEASIPHRKMRKALQAGDGAGR